MNRFWLLIPVCFVLINCISSFAQTAAYSPIDKKASSETKALQRTCMHLRKNIFSSGTSMLQNMVMAGMVIVADQM